MVITGVMDRIPDRIAQVIFLDADVPNDGMSYNDLWGPFPSGTEVVDGLVYFPWVDTNKPYPRDVPQSLKTLTEPVSFKNPKARVLPVAYVAFVAPDKIKERSGKDPSWKHAKERQWKIHTERNMAKLFLTTFLITFLACCTFKAEVNDYLNDLCASCGLVLQPPTTGN